MPGGTGSEVMLADSGSEVMLAEGAGFGQVILLLVVLVLLLVGAFFATRFVGKVARRGGLSGFLGRRARGSGRHLELLDRVALDKEKSVILLEYNGKRYLLGVTNGSFEVISEHEAPPPEEPPAEQSQSPTFGQVLQAWKKQRN